MSEAASTNLAAWGLERTRLSRLADDLVVAVAISLPWSTSATAILLALWAAVLVPTLELPVLWRTMPLPAAFLPVLLFGLGLLGVVWSEAPLSEALSGLKVFVRLLAIPLLLVQFQRSERGKWVISGYLVSCLVLLAVSWLQFVSPMLSWRPDRIGIPVKDYVIQSSEFLICAFALAHFAVSAAQNRLHARAFLCGLLALAFLANMTYVATGRSTLIIFVVLVLVFGCQRFGWKGTTLVMVTAAVLVSAAWLTSPYLRSRVLGTFQEVQAYERRGAETSAGLRLEFWKKSIESIPQAPFLGHGTGSLQAVFRREAVGQKGIAALITSNPHNQVLLLAVELGFVGVTLLLAVWTAHLLLFRSMDLFGWLGFGVIVQNVVSGLFNTYLFEFTLGWLYVLGVGVLGGMVLQERSSGNRRLPDVKTNPLG